MVTLEIAVHTSEGVQQYCEEQYNGNSLKAGEVANVYIEKAFELVEPSGSVTIESTPIPVPIEDTNTSFSACCPCYSSCFQCNYDKLIDWWKDWHPCNDVVDAQNCNLLLTSGGGGGRGGGDYATAATGTGITELPTSDPWEASNFSQAKDMWVTLQEVGHAIQEFSQLNDNDGDGDKFHDTGVTRRADGVDWVTPLGVNGTVNDCFGSADSTKKQGDLRYSECTAGKFEGVQ